MAQNGANIESVYCVHCKALHITHTHRLRPWDSGHIIDTDVIWCVKMRDWMIPLHHRLSAQRLADGINMHVATQ